METTPCRNATSAAKKIAASSPSQGLPRRAEIQAPKKAPPGQRLAAPLDDEQRTELLALVRHVHPVLVALAASERSRAAARHPHLGARRTRPLREHAGHALQHVLAGVRLGDLA